MKSLESIPVLAWYIIGAVISALSFAPLFLAGGVTPLSPLPLHAFLLVLVTWIWAPLVVSILFIVQFWLLHYEKIYLAVRIWFLGLLWVLTPVYFWGGFELGYHWMGAFHTHSVFALHLIGLTLLSLLGGLAYRRRPSQLDKVLNILSFFYFFWAAFPLLGELP